MNKLKILLIISLIFLIGYGISKIDFTEQGVSASEYNTIEDKVEKYIYVEQPLKVSEPYGDERFLIYLGKLLGHFPSFESGSSCFGVCHNVSKGGHPDDLLPTSGEWRRMKNEAYEFIGDTLNLPFDKPDIDSPSFVDNCNDTTILWQALRDSFPFELQVQKGTAGHDIGTLVYACKNEEILRKYHYLAYGHYDITFESVACAISAYEQRVVSSESNVSKGLVTKDKGFLLFDKYCYSCHAPREPAQTLPAVSLGKHEKVKSPQLTAWVFSPCDFNTCVEPQSFKFRLWEVIKIHKDVYPQLANVTYQESRSINSFILNDLTDYNLGRYE